MYKKLLLLSTLFFTCQLMTMQEDMQQSSLSYIEKSPLDVRQFHALKKGYELTGLKLPNSNNEDSCKDTENELFNFEQSLTIMKTFDDSVVAAEEIIQQAFMKNDIYCNKFCTIVKRALDDNRDLNQTAHDALLRKNRFKNSLPIPNFIKNTVGQIFNQDEAEIRNSVISLFYQDIVEDEIFQYCINVPFMKPVVQHYIMTYTINSDDSLSDIYHNNLGYIHEKIPYLIRKYLDENNTQGEKFLIESGFVLDKDLKTDVKTQIRIVKRECNRFKNNRISLITGTIIAFAFLCIPSITSLTEGMSKAERSLLMATIFTIGYSLILREHLRYFTFKDFLKNL